MRTYRPRTAQARLQGPTISQYILENNKVRDSICLTAVLCIAGLAAVVLPAGAEELVIAQVASQTNPSSASNARGLYAGLTAGLAAVNAQGGVGGKQLKLIVRDDDLNAGKMVAATKELIADKSVLALVGCLNTGGLAEWPSRTSWLKGAWP